MRTTTVDTLVKAGLERAHGFRRALVVATIAIGAMAGCSNNTSPRDDRAVVSGRVLLGDRPLLGGIVTFTSASDAGNRASCAIKKDGTYYVEDAPLGEVRVSVDTASIKSGAPARYTEIAAKYASPQTSGLSYKVEPGENAQVDFTLE